MVLKKEASRYGPLFWTYYPVSSIAFSRFFRLELLNYRPVIFYVFSNTNIGTIVPSASEKTNIIRCASGVFPEDAFTFFKTYSSFLGKEA
jgi:hypothetical protein